MARFDIAGSENFEELGADVVAIASPLDWETADADKRRAIAQRVHAFVRMQNDLDVTDIEIEPLSMGTLGEYEPTTDITRMSELLVYDDDASAAIATIAHENRHAFQSAVMQGIVEYPHGSEAEGEVDLWLEADEEYDPDDLVAYMYSPLETDARAAEAGVVIGYWKHAYSELAENCLD